MKELNKCYLIDNKYIIINYTSSKKIKYDNEKKIDRIINDGYYKINLENIILIVRSILGMENENTFRVTIVYHENITDLVYFSKGKIVKYAKKVGNNSSYLDILYTVKKGLNINLKEYISSESRDNLLDLVNLRNVIVHNNGMVDEKFKNGKTFSRVSDMLEGDLIFVNEHCIAKYLVSVLELIQVVETEFDNIFNAKMNQLIASFYFNNEIVEFD